MFWNKFYEHCDSAAYIDVLVYLRKDSDNVTKEITTIVEDFRVWK